VGIFVWIIVKRQWFDIKSGKIKLKNKKKFEYFEVEFFRKKKMKIEKKYLPNLIKVLWFLSMYCGYRLINESTYKTIMEAREYM